MRDKLTSDQLIWIQRNLGDVEFVEDLSWPNSASSALRVRDQAGNDLIIKVAAPPMEQHVDREIEAHESYVRELSRTGDAQGMVASDRKLGVLALTYLPGRLVQDSPFEFDPDVHFQAGVLLSRLHGQDCRNDDGYQRYLIDRTLQWLDGPNRVPKDQIEWIKGALEQIEPKATPVVPTHGDWHPRNWIVDERGQKARVAGIDFGRFDWRTRPSDFLRLWLMQWSGHPELEEAFLRGYGSDPRDDSWFLEVVFQAVANACWAHMVADAEFEQQGLHEISSVLEIYGGPTNPA